MNLKLIITVEETRVIFSPSTPTKTKELGLRSETPDQHIGPHRQLIGHHHRYSLQPSSKQPPPPQPTLSRARQWGGGVDRQGEHDRTCFLRAANLPPAAGPSTVHVAAEGEPSPLVSSVSSEKPVGHPAMVQWPAWDINDWEFAGGNEEDAAAAVAISDRMLDQPPRLVFGPAPTLEEATEATADLKEAIERARFSSAAAEEPINMIYFI